MCSMQAPNVSIQDPGTNTSWEQELPKVVRDLGFLGIVQDCHVSFLFSPFHTPVPFPYFVLFFEFPKCHLSADSSARCWAEGKQVKMWIVHGIWIQEALVLIQASSVLWYLASPLLCFPLKHGDVVIHPLPDSQGCCEAPLVNYSKASE